MGIHIALRHAVFHSEFQRVHMNGHSQIIGHTLRRKCSLRNSVTSHGAARGNIRIDSVSVGFQRLLVVVNLLELIGCVCHNGVGVRSVTALVGVCLQLSRYQRSILSHCRLHVQLDGMTHSRAGQRLFPGNLHTDASSAHLGAEERI